MRFDQLLWAVDYNRWERVAGNLRQRPGDNTGVTFYLILLAALVVVVWIALKVSSGRRSRQYRGPLRLLLGLCRAHRLNWRQTWLLWRLARAQQLADPGRLFLEPARLAPERIPAELRAHAEGFARIRERIYSEPAEAPQPVMPTMASGASV